MDVTPALDSFDLNQELKNGIKKEDSIKNENKKKTVKQNISKGE